MTPTIATIVGASRRSVGGACLVASSVPLLYRGISGHWPAVLNRHVQPDSTRAALGGERGTHVRESVRLEKPVADVYRFWRRLENLPRFMTHLHRVTENPDGRSHWVAAGPAGLTVEWDAEITEDRPNELIAWRSTNADVQNSGVVRFVPEPAGRGTIVRVEIKYSPPAGVVGAMVAKLFGEEPEQQVHEDLRRFKRFMETGEIPTIEGQPAGTRGTLYKLLKKGDPA